MGWRDTVQPAAAPSWRDSIQPPGGSSAVTQQGTLPQPLGGSQSPQDSQGVGSQQPQNSLVEASGALGKYLSPGPQREEDYADPLSPSPHADDKSKVMGLSMMTPAAELSGAGIIGREAINGATGAAQGAYAAPEGKRLQGGIVGLLAGLSAGMVPEAFKGGAWAAKGTGRVLGGITKPQANAYVSDPAAAEAAYAMKPYDREVQAKQAIQDASAKLQTDYIDPRKTQITQQGVGKSYRVNPGDFQGTEAYPEMERAWNVQGQTTTPTAANATYMGETPQPAPVPKSMGLTIQQLLTGKRAAGNAAQVTYSKNPLGISAADDAAAQLNAKAAVNLGRALEAHGSNSADVSRIDDELHEALNKKEQLSRINPTSIYQATDAPVSNPQPALRQYFDERTGSTFQHDADALQAARGLQGAFNPIEGKKSLPAPLARGLLKGSSQLQNASQMPIAPALSGGGASLYQILYGGGRGSDQ